MSKRLSVAVALIVLAPGALLLAAAAPKEGSRTFAASSGGKLSLDLDAGGTVEIAGTGGSSVVVAYRASCSPDCDVAFNETANGVGIATRFTAGGKQHGDIDLRIQVPARFDVEVASMGGALSIRGVEGRFAGQTHGGALTLRDVKGEAELTTMGGEITLTDSELDGQLKTMGGEVLFENVVGDVNGSSMGGNVRYKNVQRRDGKLGAPPSSDAGVREAGAETVEISTMGGDIEIEDAPEGADVHTMGGDIRVRDARRFVRAKTMGGDVAIGAVDGWVDATTMGGNIEAGLIGKGGDVTLTSMSGDVTLHVPAGFGMNLELEIAYTRNSGKDYRIDAPGGLTPTVTPDWDNEHGSPRKYVRMAGAVNGGGNAVKIKTVNGSIRVTEGK